MKQYVVDLGLLARNTQILVEKAGSAAVYGVVKGNGYGLGLLPMAKTLRESGVTRFAVADPSEATALRQGGFTREEILMLRETRLETELRELMAAGAVLCVGSTETAGMIAALAPEYRFPYPCHVKIDTGMGRYGFLPGQIEDMAAVWRNPALEVQGTFTHFHSAFNNDAATRAQFAQFQQVLEQLRKRGLDPGIRHCCNSSAFLKYPEMHLDAVRLGSSLLGRLSFGGDFGLSPIGWCEAQVEVVRKIPRGHSVGYCADWTAKRDTTIAVFSVGHFQGLSAPSRLDPASFRECVISVLATIKSYFIRRPVYVTIGGHRVPIVGNIGIVRSIADVTDISCQVGDTVRIELRPLDVKDMERVYRKS